MTQIDVTPVGEGSYEVTVTDGSSSSNHEVGIQQVDLDSVGSGATAEDLVAASFRFLLDRESKESILAKFDLNEIARYFPEYPDRIGDYL